MDNFHWLEQIQPSDRSIVGDKAFHLSRIAQLGYPVIPGFVVAAHIWRQFLETLNGTESLVADLPNSSLHLNIDNPYQLQRVAQRLRQEMTTAPLPLEWIETLFNAVKCWHPALIFRPSLALSNGNYQNMQISGLLEAQICHCDQEAVALALKQTWSQLFRARSLLYWQRAGIRIQQINLAVLVQPLINAIASGCLSYNLEQLEIKASWGLGMAIARGEVIPDSYIVQPKTGTVLSQQLGNKTIAYGLVDSPAQTGFTPCPMPLLPQTAGGCLQTYLLTEAQQQQYALKDKYLQELIQLTVELANKLGSAFSLEWTLSQNEDSVAPQLYLTQVNTSDERSPLYSPHPRQYLIKGLAAAVGRVVAPAYVMVSSKRPKTLPPGVILVAPEIAPDWLPLLQQAAGIVTEQGGLNSHCAILARELGIPAVVNTAQATQLIQTGESVLLDGDHGEVYRFRQEGGEIGKHLPSHPITSSMTSHQPLIATQLMVNLSQPSLIERVRSLPVDGVGLLRSELMALTLLAGQHPNTWLALGREAELLKLWQEQICQFARAFAPRPVFYRSLDWRSHEFQSLTSGSFAAKDPTHTPETNPMLGQRGTFNYLQNPQLFDLELAALAAVQQSGYTNLHLLLPFVRTVEEFSFCRRRVEQAGLNQIAQFQLWMMAEVPSALFLIPEYVQAGVQGISIGTNDLTQLLLGVDRDQGQLAEVFDERHPVVMQAIAQLIHLTKQANIPCSVCGQAPVLYPELIDSLVRWGITSISVELEAIDSTYAAIARAEQRLILEAARRQLS